MHRRRRPRSVWAALAVTAGVIILLSRILPVGFWWIILGVCLIACGLCLPRC